MTSRVFTTEAMVACASTGHRWRRVYSWHDVGCSECERCGETGPVTSDSQVAAMARETVAQVGQQESRAASGSTPEQSGHAALGGPGLNSQAVHQVRVGPGQRQPRRSPSPRAKADVAAGGDRQPSHSRPCRAAANARSADAAAKRAERNASIVRLYVAGDSGPDLADAFGIHVTVVYAVLRAAGVTRRPGPPRTPQPEAAACTAAEAP